MTTIRVDLNNITTTQLLKATLRAADGPLTVGQAVVAFDIGEQLEFDAEVTSIDEETWRVMLRVDWESERTARRGVKGA